MSKLPPSTSSLVLAPKSFEGHDIDTILYKGRPCWPAAQVGQALGYERDGLRFVNQVTGKWADELIEGQDFIKVEGEEMRDLVGAMGDHTKSVSSFAGRMVFLFESGLHLTCLKTRQPAGVRMRRWLAEEVLPDIARKGSFTQPTIAEHLVPVVPIPVSPAPMSPATSAIAALDQIRGLFDGAFAEVKTSLLGQQATIDILHCKVAEIDARTQPKPKKARAMSESPADREDIVIKAIRELGEDATMRRIADQCGRSYGQIKVSLAVLKASDKVAQRGATFSPNWVLLDKRPANVIPFHPGKPTEAEMEVALSWREKLYNYVEAAAEQECLRTKKNTKSERADVFRDHWNRLFASAAQEGMECRGRESVGKPVPRIEYAEAKGWCEPILRRCAMRLFRVDSMPVPRPSDIACHSEVR